MRDKRTLHSQVGNHTRTFEKKFPCLECGQKFLNIRKLSSHMLKHTGQKTYKCRLCSLETRLLPLLLKLFIKFHPLEKIFNCELSKFYTNNLREKNKHYTSMIHLGKEAPVRKNSAENLVGGFFLARGMRRNLI